MEVETDYLVSYVANSCFGCVPNCNTFYTFTTLVCPSAKTCASSASTFFSTPHAKEIELVPRELSSGPYPCTTNLPLLDKSMCLISPSGLKASRQNEKSNTHVYDFAALKQSVHSFSQVLEHQLDHYLQKIPFKLILNNLKRRERII